MESSKSTDYNELLHGLSSRVTERMNHILTRSVTKQEVKQAVFSVKSGSAPRADGMSGPFFQSYWDIVGDLLPKEVLVFFLKLESCQQNGTNTHLCLILKKTDASMMSDLRPISLCTVMYKTISKILASRLKPLLSSIVSPNQHAFVSNCLISDHIIMVHEAVHSLRTHDYVSKNFVAAKTDMSKAFDRVD